MLWLVPVLLLAGPSGAQGEGAPGSEVLDLVAQAARLVRDHGYPRASPEAILLAAIRGISADLDIPSEIVAQRYHGTDHLRGLEVEPTVTAARLIRQGPGYLKLDRFGPRSPSEVKRALELLEAQGIQGLVLDLRDNDGGRLDQAREIAEIFLPRGSVVYWERGRDQGIIPHLARGSGSARRLAILIGPRTASAAELVAGALRGHRRAVLVGKPSAGEGYIRTAFPLGRGFVLWLPTGEYLLPDQSRVQGRGLLPDITEDDPARLLELAAAAVGRAGRADQAWGPGAIALDKLNEIRKEGIPDAP